MSVEVWQNLPKAQDDSETIEQAIARLIVAHNDDVTAHLGENQSIEAHRKSEVIDHLAASIVNDKISEFQITQDKINFDKIVYTTQFADFNLWTVEVSGGEVDQGLGYVRIEAAPGTSNYARLKGWNPILMLRPASQRIVWQCFANIEFDYIPYKSFFGFGITTYERIGFQWEADKLYAYFRNHSLVEQKLEITGFTCDQQLAYKIITRPGEGADYYINGTLVASLDFYQQWDISNTGLFEMKGPDGDYNNLYIYWLQVFIS